MSKFTLSDLSIDDINLIIVGLNELPGKYISGIIPKIRTQLESQGVRPAPGSQAADAMQSAQVPIPTGPLSSKVVY